MDETVTVNSNREIDMPSLCRPIVEASPMPMAATEGAGHVVRYLNPAFCRLTGKTGEELIGNPFSHAVPAGDECLPVLDRLYQTGQPQIHLGHEDSATHGFWWSYAMWPVLAADGRVIGSMIQVTEATSFHQQAIVMNQALLIGSVRQHELTEQAQALNDLLHRANEDLKQFAFAASHDLQEPLRMITNYSQLLIEGHRGQLAGEAQLCMDFITKGAKQMRDLLANLLTYTEAGADSREPNQFIDLNAILEKVNRNLNLAIQESGAAVTSGDLPTVRGDDARFVQLFQNLIGNAIKYRGKDPPRIHVSAEYRDAEWRFAVTDNGMGIEPEYYLMIFGVFKRLHGSAIPGTGIGLAICQRVIERYGGRIWVESKVGQGTSFYFTLPGAPETAERDSGTAPAIAFDTGHRQRG
jgi:PAS domain S-box-containing protein